MSTHQISIPFKLEGNTASREAIRSIAKNTDGLHKVNLSLISIRPEFNARIQGSLSDEMYERVLMIPELADAIFESNGPAEPLLGDFYREDGRFYVTNGERRFRALRHLLATNRAVYPNGKEVSDVTVLLNPAGTTDLERKRKVIATQDNLKLKPMERAFYYLRFKTEDNMTHADIAKFLHVSRQTVDNYILATDLPAETQEAIDKGELTFSAAIDKYRTAKSKKDNPSLDDVEETPSEAKHRLKKEKENASDGDEEEFEQQDNSVNFGGSMSGPKEAGSGAITIGKDTIYKDQEDTARWKQFLHRHDVLSKQCYEFAIGDLDEAQKKLIELLKQEFVIQIK